MVAGRVSQGKDDTSLLAFVEATRDHLQGESDKMAGASFQQHVSRPFDSLGNLLDDLNGRWHKWAGRIFIVIVVSHWAEHLLQALQIWVLDWSRPQARGGLGLLFPWLVKSEWLHYWYAVAMLVGLVILRPAFVGRARRWWDIALAIQFWHHFEHALLLFQVAVLHHNLFGSKVPTSIVQLFVPRVELHLFYNAVVTIPMLIAMWYHLFPSREEAQKMTCTCAVKREAPAAA